MEKEKVNVLRSAPAQPRPNGTIQQMAEVLMLSPDELTERKIIFPGMRQREVLNAFREIRTRLLQKMGSSNFVLLVSSVGTRTSSSFTAINIAAAIALDERMTALYVDCNLYSPFAPRLLPTEPEYGLTDYLDSQTLGVEEIIYASGIPRLRVVPPGRPHETAVEYFNSQRMRNLIDALKHRYPDRFIILDVPPVSATTEARVLAQLCDAAVLVVPFGEVTQSQVLAGVDAVGRERFAGLIFNE